MTSMINRMMIRMLLTITIMLITTMVSMLIMMKTAVMMMMMIMMMMTITTVIAKTNDRPTSVSCSCFSECRKELIYFIGQPLSMNFSRVMCTAWRQEIVHHCSGLFVCPAAPVCVIMH